VREVLNRLKEKGYLVINGPVLLYDGVKKEYDHIVIGENGVFSLETKAFGVSKDGKNKASLYIDKGDKWTLRKNGANRELKSPTSQILSERDHLKNILYNAKEKIEVKPVLVLSNSKLYLKKNIKLDYDVIFVKKLEEYILSAELNRIIPEEQRLIAEILDEHRINA
ncbi:MAG: NERD domain-containing protein, partial [Lachnospiraceae bacterium]|nr:NERD domain-containing protein [Lachnospiraceae bacterium]